MQEVRRAGRNLGEQAWVSTRFLPAFLCSWFPHAFEQATKAFYLALHSNQLDLVVSPRALGERTGSALRPPPQDRLTGCAHLVEPTHARAGGRLLERLGVLLGL